MLLKDTVIPLADQVSSFLEYLFSVSLFAQQIGAYTVDACSFYFLKLDVLSFYFVSFS